jgi:hypothetical protein
MNFPIQNPLVHQSSSAPELGAAEETLRLIARLPAPVGLADRVHAGLLTSPRKGRILFWRGSPRLDSGWMRSAAAAAIVCVVAGGGWGIYSRVPQPKPAQAIALPPHFAAPGGFASAGAMRTPQTLNGPVLAHPAATQPVQPKAPAKAAKKPSRHASPSETVNSVAQPVAPPVN